MNPLAGFPLRQMAIQRSMIRTSFPRAIKVKHLESILLRQPLELPLNQLYRSVSFLSYLLKAAQALTLLYFCNVDRKQVDPFAAAFGPAKVETFDAFGSGKTVNDIARAIDLLFKVFVCSRCLDFRDRSFWK